MADTIKTLLGKGINFLKKEEYNNPQLDAELLLRHVLKVDKVYIYTHLNEEVDREDVDEFLDLVNKRNKGYPLQYIIGNQEFMGLNFNVGEGVLVPRPDTEILVEKIIDMAKDIDKESIDILDIGTGSGAITLSLAYYIKNSNLYSIDISSEALEIARKNRDNLGLCDRVEFINTNILDGFNFLDKKIDIIVSNPPYIPTIEIEKLQKEVSMYEPKLALDGGEDGLKFYRYITKEGKNHLTDEGILAFEIGYDQGKEVYNIMRENGFIDINIIKDLEDRDRVVIGRRG